MANKSKFQAIRGTRDLLPPETALWNHVEQAAHTVFGTFGFGEIRPPVFEPTDLFARAVGGETDIVSKEMYTFADPADNPFEYIQRQLRELGHEGYSKFATEDPDKLRREIYERSEVTLVSLRPEATASVCRAYIEHNMQQLAQPVKLYYVGPMFRRERPQKGRYRQFYQIGAEGLGGSDAPAIDATGAPDRSGNSETNRTPQQLVAATLATARITAKNPPAPSQVRGIISGNTPRVPITQPSAASRPPLL